MLTEFAHPVALQSDEVGFGSNIDRLTYAIGDIHGRFDLFKKMITLIRSDSKALNERPVIVLLGDYIDRGPDSALVVEAILHLQQKKWCDVVVLMGNHEKTLLNFIHDAGFGSRWVEYGGLPTFHSYGVRFEKLPREPEEWEAARMAFIQAIPPEHLKLYGSMKLKYEAGDYFFVHAGVEPGVALEEQGHETLLWIRNAFLSVEKASEKVVVHGHTPDPTPSNTEWRIGVDTGAYATGVLTAIRLQRQTRSILQAQ